MHCGMVACLAIKLLPCAYGSSAQRVTFAIRSRIPSRQAGVGKGSRQHDFRTIPVLSIVLLLLQDIEILHLWT